MAEQQQNEWVHVPGLEQVLDFIETKNEKNEENENKEEEANETIIETPPAIEEIRQRKRQRIENQVKRDIVVIDEYNTILQRIITGEATVHEHYEVLRLIPATHEFEELTKFICDKLEKKENEFTPERILSLIAMFVFFLNAYSTLFI